MVFWRSALVNLVLSREKLQDMLTKEYIEAAPWTGEYHAGKADLLNELLGNDPIDWAKHPNYARHAKR